jgi:DNA-binding MarR family transcriptional regulator
VTTQIDGSEDETPRWLDDAEMAAWRAFIDGSQRLMGLLNRELQDRHGLTTADYRILVMLSESPDGSVRMSDLADGVISSRSKLTHQIRRMEADGMVTRNTCLDDGRGVLAILTEEGRRRLEEAAPTHVNGVRRYLVDLLDADELTGVERVFTKVNTAIGERSAG